MDGLALARVLHVLAVVVWIGGVSIVTTALLPAVRRSEFGADWLAAFQAIERRFARQARVAIVIVGLTGLYMIVQADMWDRFRSAEYWWMHAMVCIWAIFAIGLFLVEPLFLDRRLRRRANERMEAVFAQLAAVHWVLLTLSLITIFGAVAGSHGWSVF
jgi:uncharacterized membrane protein